MIKILTACLAFVFISGPAMAAGDRKMNPDKLKNKVTFILPQTISIQFEEKANALTDPKVVGEPDPKKPGVEFKFEKKPESVTLVTQNPYAKTLTFRALIRLKGRKDFTETSTLPIDAGIFSLESWSDPVEELVLFDFKLSKPKE